MRSPVGADEGTLVGASPRQAHDVDATAHRPRERAPADRPTFPDRTMRVTLFLGTEVAGSEPGASTRTRPAWCREHEGGSDARVAQASPSGVPVKIEQSGVGEHAHDRVGVRGLGEFVDNGRVGVGHVQCRKARTGHEAGVGRADSGSREVVVAVVVVVDESSTECVMPCARVVVGAVGAFCGESPFEAFAHRFGQERPGDGGGRRESVRVKCGDASSRNEKSGNLASCLLARGMLFRPLANRYDIFPGHRGYDTPGVRKHRAPKGALRRPGEVSVSVTVNLSESTERQTVH